MCGFHAYMDAIKRSLDAISNDSGSFNLLLFIQVRGL